MVEERGLGCSKAEAGAPASEVAGSRISHS